MRSNLFFKVEIEHDSEEDARELSRQITRQIQKVYGVRLAELSSLTTSDE